MRNYPSVGVQIPDIYIPSAGIDLTKWAVIACDQFTSQPEYWNDVKRIVNGQPSTINLILPEIYLGTPEENELISCSKRMMRKYLTQKILHPLEGMVFIERSSHSGTRYGLLLALDLERYDFNTGAKSLIRSTEGTILNRLPPRIRIRENANLELPHILVLIDDPQQSVIEPIKEHIALLTKIYDFELMLDSGHLRGYLIDHLEIEKNIIKSLGKLADVSTYHQKYHLKNDEQVLLFAVGDGNHSLATAKSVWDNKKAGLSVDHPLRYALVEIENIHDEGLQFEPIHRVIFGIKKDLREAMQEFFDGTIHFKSCNNTKEMIQFVKGGQIGEQRVGLVTSSFQDVVNFEKPLSNLTVGTLQMFLDDFLHKGGADHIDYLHGEEAFLKISQQQTNYGFYLPVLDKNELFRTVILDGSLPRKTFSMGEAKDKRFYLESRKIQDL
jgi:hypothetical protein